MKNITFEFACQDDCLEKMVPSDLRQLVAERDSLRAQLAERESEAVGRVDLDGTGTVVGFLTNGNFKVGDKLYTTPQPPAVPEWQPIETAPKNGSDVLLCWWSTFYADQGEWVFECAPAGNIDVARQGCGYLHGHATHWMPLPEPPTAMLAASGEGE